MLLKGPHKLHQLGHMQVCTNTCLQCPMCESSGHVHQLVLVAKCRKA